MAKKTPKVKKPTKKELAEAERKEKAKWYTWQIHKRFAVPFLLNRSDLFESKTPGVPWETKAWNGDILYGIKYDNGYFQYYKTRGEAELSYILYQRGPVLIEERNKYYGSEANR